MLVANEERLNNKGSEEEWWVTLMPKLRYWLGVEHVNIIKLDCEGCEVRESLLFFVPFAWSFTLLNCVCFAVCIC